MHKLKKLRFSFLASPFLGESPSCVHDLHTLQIFSQKKNPIGIQDDPDGHIERSRRASKFLLISCGLWPPTSRSPIESSSSSTQQRRRRRPRPCAAGPCHAVPMRAEGRGGVPPDLDNAVVWHHDSIEKLARLARFRLQEPTGWATAGRKRDGGAEKRQGGGCIPFSSSRGSRRWLTAAAETFVLCFFAAGRRHARGVPPYSGGVFVADETNNTTQKVPRRSPHRAGSIIPLLISLRSVAAPPSRTLGGSPRNALIGIPPPSGVCFRGGSNGPFSSSFGREKGVRSDSCNAPGPRNHFPASQPPLGPCGAIELSVPLPVFSRNPWDPRPWNFETEKKTTMVPAVITTAAAGVVRGFLAEVWWSRAGARARVVAAERIARAGSSLRSTPYRQ